MKVRYVMITLVCIIVLIGGLVSYGIYLNVSNSSHIEKLATAQYSRVTGARVTFKEVTPVLYVSALNLQTSWMLDIHAKLDGTVTQVYAAPGDKVRAGQVLAELVNEELPLQVLQAEGKVREAQANFIKWESTKKRYKELVASGGISMQQLDDAEANFRAAEASVMSMEAYRDQLSARLGGQKILAPQDGDVLKVYHTVGSFVRPGDSMVMIGDFSVLYAKSNVKQAELEQLMPLNTTFKLSFKNGQAIDKYYEANFRSQTLTGDQGYDMMLVKIEPPLDTPSQYRSLLWKISNPSAELEPGTYHQLKIGATSAQRVLAIPKAALLNEAAAAVFVVTQDGRLAKKTVKTGVQDDEYVEVLEGLVENDMVVVSGKVGLSPDMKVQVVIDAPVQ